MGAALKRALSIADLRGYTSLSQSLAPDAMSALLDTFYDECASAIWEHDGLLNKTLYKSGASGRYLMGGQWYFKADLTGNGSVADFAVNPSTAGWKAVTVPNAWNTGDYSEASFAGGVGWYRKSFHLPSAKKALSWNIRFESVNYRTRVYLNGHLVGKNTGAYLPFEIRLPAGYLKRGGNNVLAVRVDSRRFPTDFPPSGLSSTGVPTGGWWNYGGLLREVYLREIKAVDFKEVSVLPDLPCGSCDASLTYSATVRNYSDKGKKVKITARLGAKTITLGSANLGPKATKKFTRKVGVKNPHTWSPTNPYLYTTSFAARSGKDTLQTYYNRMGIRSIKVVDGHLMLNGKPLRLTPQSVVLILLARRDNESSDDPRVATVLRALVPYAHERNGWGDRHLADTLAALG